MDIKISFDGVYQVKDTTKMQDIKILMLKGEKGDAGEGGDGKLYILETSGSPLLPTVSADVIRAEIANGNGIAWKEPSGGLIPARTVSDMAGSDGWLELQFVLVNDFPLPSLTAIQVVFQYFYWDNSTNQWTNTSESKTIFSDRTPTATEVGAIPAPSSPSAGQFLVYDGSAWVAQTLSQWTGGSY